MRKLIVLVAGLSLAACTAPAPTVVPGTDTPTASSVSATSPVVPTSASPTTTATPRPTTSSPTSPTSPEPRDLSLARSRTEEDSYYPEWAHPELDVLHYDLDLSWDGSTLEGEAAITFRVTKDTDTVGLALVHSLEPEIVIDDVPATVKRDGSHLRVTGPAMQKDSQHVMRVSYRGTPVAVNVPATRGDMAEGIGWRTSGEEVYSFQEPWGALTWFPSHDHPSDKAYYDVRVHTKAPLVGVFPGQLTNQSEVDGIRTMEYHLDKPASTYLVTIAIGRYQHSSVTLSDGTPFNVWLPTDMERYREEIENGAQEVHDWLLERAGPYPFASGGVVVVDGDSAMETQTLITMSRSVVETRFLPVLLHEHAHQWFGDAVSPRTWQDLWLNEGWAMYQQIEFEDPSEVLYGGRAGLDSMCSGLSEEAGPAAAYDPKQFASSNVYICPAGYLKELHTELGDAKFFELSKGWVRSSLYGNSSREEFEEYLASATGRDRRDELSAWVDRGAAG